MNRLVLIIALALCVLAGCRNVPAENRDRMRSDVQGATPETRDEVRTRLRQTLVGDGSTPRSVDPHLRASAAQGLGDLGDPADAELLLDVLLGPLADDSTQVRMEAAIAVGKLYYPPQDPLRRIITRTLRDRVAYDRDDSGRLFETEFTVRNAMVNSIIALGGRPGATALHDIATRLHTEETASGLFTGATDKGLLDRCFNGMADITGTSRREAALHRVENDDLTEHLNWWAERIMLMQGS